MGKEQELLDAARSGNIALIEKILNQRKWTGPLAIPLPSLSTIRKGVHPNCQDSNGETPLHHASLNGHKDVVELLLKLQASANIPDQKGCYPLHLSAWRGNAEVCEVLLSHGPSVAKVNQQNLDGDTALHSAAQYGHNRVVELLLKNHADPSIKNTKGEKALGLAIQYGRLETVQLLLNATKNVLNIDDKSQIYLAAKNGHKQVFQVLLDAGFDINNTTNVGTVLHEACMYGRIEIVKLLLEKGIDINIKDGEDKTAVDLLNDLNTPISLETKKIINDFTNGAKHGQQNIIRLSSVEDVEYDYLPNSSRPIIEAIRCNARESVSSQDSSVFDSISGQTNVVEIEENIYDQPRALKIQIDNTNKISLSSSFKDDVPLRSPDTPKKPPRKRIPQSIMVKVASQEKSESTENTTNKDNVTTTIHVDMSTATTNATSDESNEISRNESNNEMSVMTVKVCTNSTITNNKTNCTENNNDLPLSVALKKDNINENTVTSSSTRCDNNSSNVASQCQSSSSATVRPPSLNLNEQLTLSSYCNDIPPLSPSRSEQPPTPEHPPPSPMTALLGIQDKINPKERRQSRDMETITETEYLSNVAVFPLVTYVSSSTADGRDRTKIECNNSSKSNGATSLNDCCHDVLIVSDKNPYHGLTMGSMASSNQRRVKSQILDNVYVQRLNRNSIPGPCTTFDPLIERTEEQESTLHIAAKKINPGLIENDVSTRPQTRKLNCTDAREKISSLDETEEWAKVKNNA